MNRMKNLSKVFKNKQEKTLEKTEFHNWIRLPVAEKCLEKSLPSCNTISGASKDTFTQTIKQTHTQKVLANPDYKYYNSFTLELLLFFTVGYHKCWNNRTTEQKESKDKR